MMEGKGMPSNMDNTTTNTKSYYFVEKSKAKKYLP